MTHAVIKRVRLGAAHEGVAELVLDIEHASGGITEVPMDTRASHALMMSCRARTVDDLIGQSWEKVRDAIAESYNRSNPGG